MTLGRVDAEDLRLCRRRPYWLLRAYSVAFRLVFGPRPSEALRSFLRFPFEGPLNIGI